MRDIIQELHDKVKEDLTPLEVDSMYDYMLDECYSFESVGGIFLYMQPSRVLREMDPIAYRCGFTDWLDGENFYEVDGEYYYGTDLERIKDELIDELESDISDHEDDLSTLDEEDEPEEVAITSNCIAALEELLVKLRKYSF